MFLLLVSQVQFLRRRKTAIATINCPTNMVYFALACSSLSLLPRLEHKWCLFKKASRQDAMWRLDVGVSAIDPYCFGHGGGCPLK